MQKSITLFTFLCLFVSSNIYAKNTGAITFSSGEHIYIGNKATLYFPVKTKSGYTDQYITGNKANFQSWLLPQLHQSVSFGQIVAMPDLFADSHNAISDGKSFSAQRLRFEKSFNAFLKANPKTINKVLNIMHEEVVLIKNALDQGIPPSQAYAQKGSYFIKKYLLTDPLTIKLFFIGWDHFGQTAWLAYQAGHAEAIATALAAHAAIDPQIQQKLLVLAYAKEAYTCHFLSDQFASGHMRTPAKALSEVMSKEIAAQAISAILAILMHNEDNLYGLQVTNARGDQWTAYGDTQYLDDHNKQNKKLIDETVQASINEVTQAFQKGIKTSPDQYAAKAIVPDTKRLKDYKLYVDNKNKTVPLFAPDRSSQDVLRRNDINQLHPKKLPLPQNTMRHHGGLHGWWGLTTLLELKLYYHPTFAFNKAAFSTLLKSNGQLNSQGLYLLVHNLSFTERILFCADISTDKILRNYLTCKPNITPKY